MTHIIDGKVIAAGVRAQVAQQVSAIQAAQGIRIGLAVALIGDDPASQIYVRNKKKMTEAVGMQSFEHHLPNSTSQAELLALIAQLNANPDVHGILVQLPLPQQLDENAVIAAIDPAKDVDGFHVVNTGLLATAQQGALVSCTPLGCLMLIQRVCGTDLSGKHAVVIGRSNIVGKPMAQLLLNHHATVTICHSRTANLPALCAQADIVVAAVGKPEMVRADWVKDGAVVIDVGINRIADKLLGDVAFDEVAAKASAITPVPGGVGPMTIACLLRNTLQAACAQHNLPFML
jgi:methylenetetrahydrofolate dehydrogenase (NADP+) / methenyltetrahydrofolate cyclohydrolase